MEIKVSWQMGEKGIKGKMAYSYETREVSHKICFPLKGSEFQVCMYHTQECTFVRDTQPGQRKGAIIARPLPCSQCKRIKDTLEKLGSEWTCVDGRIVAPDGKVQVFYLDNEIYTGVISMAQKEYEERERIKYLKYYIQETKFESISCPQGEPMVPEKPEWREPPEFTVLTTEKGVTVAVHPMKGIGFAQKSHCYEYESDDGMSTRKAGGELQWVPLGYSYWKVEGPWQDNNLPYAESQKLHDEYAKKENDKLQKEVNASPAAQAALKKIQEEHTSRNSRHADYIFRKKEYETARKNWLDWWALLTDAQKIRFGMRTEREDTLASLSGTKIVSPIVGKRLLNLKMRFRPFRSSLGIVYFRDYPYMESQIEAIDILMAENFED